MPLDAQLQGEIFLDQCVLPQLPPTDNGQVR